MSRPRIHSKPDSPTGTESTLPTKSGRSKLHHFGLFQSLLSVNSMNKCGLIMLSTLCLIVYVNTVQVAANVDAEGASHQRLDGIQKTSLSDASRLRSVRSAAFDVSPSTSNNKSQLSPSTDEGTSGKAGGTSKPPLANSCESKIYPCSDYIMGNMLLILYYGLTLGFSAKMISDGSEMLLDLGVAPALIGGVILPVSGVVPDSMMILVSGLGEKSQAQDQISVGMGTLAGSTILLLTLAWAISLYVGRVDLVQAPTCYGLVANSESRCTGVSLTKQGVEISKEVTISAFVMLVTMFPYFIIQSADWYFGPTVLQKQQPGYVQAAALVTFIFSITGFFLYLAMQFKLAQEGSNARMAMHAKEKEQEMLLKAARAFYMANFLKGGGGGNPFAPGGGNKQFGGGNNYGAIRGHGDVNGGYEKLSDFDGRDRMLEKKYFEHWRITVKMRQHQRTQLTAGDGASNDMELKNMGGTGGMANGSAAGGSALSPTGGEGGGNGSSEENSEGKETRSKILAKSLTLLTTGIAMVTVFSDPMCDTLSRITDKNNPEYLPITPFYISFIVTPLCSNASELVSSISFAMKKEKDNLILTYTQLYSAAIMNNTLCLGVFCGLVYFRDLQWYFSAEVTAILVVEALMGAIALKFRKIYFLALAIPVSAIYIFSLLIVSFLEDVLHWG